MLRPSALGLLVPCWRSRPWIFLMLATGSCHSSWFGMFLMPGTGSCHSSWYWMFLMPATRSCHSSWYSCACAFMSASTEVAQVSMSSSRLCPALLGSKSASSCSSSLSVAFWEFLYPSGFVGLVLVGPACALAGFFCGVLGPSIPGGPGGVAPAGELCGACSITGVSGGFCCIVSISAISL